MFIIAIYTLVLDGIFSHHRKQTGASWTNVYRLKDRLWELNCGILGILLAEGAAFVITGSLKNLCGKPRPDLIARCQPIEGAVDPPVFGLSNSTICTQTDKAIMADGFRSFPSGHSSSAFAGLFYLSLYLAAKLHVLDNRGEVWRTFIVLIPTLAASCIAMSRIMDARHHPFDVLFGSAMGILVAWAAYRQYFPPVGETWKKGRAYPIRTWGTEVKGPPPMGGNELVQKDSDLEPYRTRVAAASSSSAHMPGVGLGVDPSAQQSQQQRESGNVFRDQISRSQRQRTSNPNDGGGSTVGNPYVTTADGTRYVSPTQRDEDWSATSSEDEVYGRRETDGAGPVEGFEMQPPSYRGSGDPEGQVGGGQIRHAPPSAVSSRLGGGELVEQDTAYRGQAQNQSQSQMTGGLISGPMHPGQRVLA
jgi:diacylglycerol diphosphate phosphatase / phosphatidate phosphatase